MAADGEELPPVIAELQANAEEFQATVDEVKEQLASLDVDHADPTVGLDTSDFEAKVAEVEAQMVALGAEEDDFGRSTGDAATAADALDAALAGTFTDADRFGEAMFNSGVSAEALASAAENAGVSLESFVADADAAAASGVTLGDYMAAVGAGFLEVGFYAATTAEDVDLFGGDLFNVAASAEEVNATLGDSAAAILGAWQAVDALEGALIDGETAMNDFETAVGDGGAGLGSFSDWLGTIGGELGSVLQPLGGVASMIGLITLGVTVLAPLVGVLVGALGALSSIGFVAFGGLGAVALAIVPDLMSVMTAYQQINQYEQQFNTATTPSAKLQAYAQLEDYLKSINPLVATLVGDLTQAKTAFESWDQQFQPQILDLFNAGLQVFDDLLHDISPLVGASLSEFTILLGQLADGLQSPAFQRLITWMTEQVQPVFQTLFTVITNIGEGLATMAQVGQPFTDMISRGLISLSQDFDKFASSNTFKDFVNWLVQNGPTIGSDIEKIGGDIGKIVTVLAPYGVQLLNFFTLLTGGLSTLVSTIGGIPQAVSGLGNIWSGTWGAMKTAWDVFWNPVHSGFTTLQGALSALSGPLNTLKGIWDTVWGDVKSVFGSSTSAISPGLATISGGLSTLGGAANTLKGIWDTVWGALGGAVQAAIGPISGAISTITGLINGLVSALNTVKSVISSVLPTTTAPIKGLTDVPAPGGGGGAPSPSKIPGAASGGLVRSPTLLIAGEAGPEMIVPESQVPGGFGGGGLAPLPPLGGAGGDSLTHNGDINIYTQPGQSPQAIATEVRSTQLTNARRYGTGGIYGRYGGNR